MRLYTAMQVAEARSVIRKRFGVTEAAAETVDLLEAFDRVLAQDVTAAEDIPAFTRSTVDGYAVKAKETFGAGEGTPAFLTVSGSVNMGETAGELSSGQAIYVPTGGMLPTGADAVVMIEETAILDDMVNIYKQVAPAENVIARGDDITTGSAIFTKGKRLRSADIGVLASLGIDRVAVYLKPQVAVLSTGDELAHWSEPELAPGMVRDCNAPALLALAREMGAVGSYGGLVRDDYAELKAQALSLLAANDILVLSGGSSVGMRDYTTRLLKELSNDDLLIEGIAVQPGKPTLLAGYETGGRAKAILGLPGHPVSALNVFDLIGRELIEAFAGAEPRRLPPSVVRGELTQNIPSVPGRCDIVRVTLESTADVVFVTPVLGRSGLLKTLRRADGVVMVAETKEGLPKGSMVDVQILV